MAPHPATAPDDRPTIVAMAVLAYIVQDVLHEGLGHGVTAWLSGAHQLTISTVALQSDIDTRWISANGTLVNLATAAILWPVLTYFRRLSPRLHYFLALTLAGSLFTGTGYFFFSGVTNFGDWAAVIRGLQPHWIWQLGLVIVGAAAYYLSMLIVASVLRPFQGDEDHGRRLRRACWLPYLTEGILALVAGLLNPAGLFYVIASALPSTLGANTGLIVLPFMMRAPRFRSGTRSEPIRRSPIWIAAGIIVALLFILVLGRGIRWSR
jgi:hypothetical protein